MRCSAIRRDTWVAQGDSVLNDHNGPNKEGSGGSEWGAVRAQLEGHIQDLTIKIRHKEACVHVCVCACVHVCVCVCVHVCVCAGSAVCFHIQKRR